MSNGIVPLVAGSLYALPNPYELDGRVSTHPADARGFASMNSYLIVERGHALLIDTGLSVHREELLDQLDALLGPARPLAIWALRIGEYNSICNVRALVERREVTTLYAAVPHAGRWVGAPRVASEQLRPGDELHVDPDGRRRIQVLPAPLRLLPTHWAYDQQTRTLFSSDAFAHAWRETAAGPWTIGSVYDDPVDLDGLCDYLLGSRFWWLAGADTRPLRTQMAQVFDRFDVEHVAPAYGCVLRGRTAVRRHRQLLDAALARLAREPAPDPRLAAVALP